MKFIIKELGLSIVLIILAVLLLNPFQWMSVNELMVIVALFVVVVSGFFSFIWRERARDEREFAYRNAAGRVGYLLGSGVLVVGIIMQTVAHELDPWLVVALIAMVIGKNVGLFINNNSR